jgi:acetyl esterase/lipase
MSVMAKMLVATMKKQPRFAMPPEDQLDEFRKTAIAGNEALPMEKGVTFSSGKVGKVPIEIATPSHQKSDDYIYYIHGGGFIYGTCSSTRSYASYLAESTGLKVYTVTYRLAPEYKAPCALDDCMEVYRYLLQENAGHKMALIGESAGGNLVMAVMLRVKDEGLTLPVCIEAIAPCVNLAEQYPSRTTNDKTDPSVSGQGIADLTDAYVGNGDPKDPYVSPIYGDFTGCPPLYVVADQGEVLFDDSTALVAAAQAAGVEVSHYYSKGLFHTFPVLGKMLPEGKEAMQNTVAFFEKHLSKA